MVSKALQTAAENIGFTYVEKNNSKQSYLYGIWEGYLITLHDSGNQKNAFINYYLEPTDEADESVRLLELSEEVKAFAEDYSIIDYAFENIGMSFTATCSIEAFEEVLAKMVLVLSNHSISGADRCSSCGNKIGKRLPKRLFAEKRNYLLCEHCALEKMENQSSESGNSSTNGLVKKTFLGAVGATIGGLIGALIYFLIYNYVDPLFSESAFEMSYVFCLLGFAIAFLVYQGFKFFSKQPCTSAYVVVGAVTLISTALGQYLGSFAANAAAFEFQLSEAVKIPAMWLILLRSTASENINIEEPSAMFYKLLCFSMLFAVIGVILFLMGFYEKSKIKKEPFELVTLRV